MQSMLFSLIVRADAHGSLSLPPSRNGGSLSKGSDKDSHDWFVSGSPIPGNVTLPSELNFHHPCEGNQIPWCAPGTAAVISPCGTACDGGKHNPAGSGDNACVDPTVNDGLDLPKTKRMVWHQDEIVDVAWSISIGHGGGYAYRLCPASEDTTEACFQKLEHHMEFVDDFHTILWTEDGTEEIIPAKRTKIGTFPAGSQWSLNPIPAEGRGRNTLEQPCSIHSCGTYPGVSDQPSFSIKDRVRVPSLAPGNYTVSWRWDCEETSNQVWTNCADVEIVVGAACPGGSLSECIGLCPDKPAVAYQACTETCLQRCSSLAI